MIYTSPDRVIRDGHLIAFAGETMSQEEAARRGLLDRAVDACADEAPKQDEMTNAQIKEVLDDLGVEYPKRAKKATLLDILAAATTDDVDDYVDDDDDDLYDDDDDDEETE